MNLHQLHKATRNFSLLYFSGWKQGRERAICTSVALGYKPLPFHSPRLWATLQDGRNAPYILAAGPLAAAFPPPAPKDMIHSLRHAAPPPLRV